MSKEEITQAVKEAVREALSEGGGCTARACLERCGITPVQHAEAHKTISEFFQMLTDVNKAIRGTIIKIIVGVGIVAAAIGLGLNVDKFIK